MVSEGKVFGKIERESSVISLWRRLSMWSSSAKGDLWVNGFSRSSCVNCWSAFAGILRSFVRGRRSASRLRCGRGLAAMFGMFNDPLVQLQDRGVLNRSDGGNNRRKGDSNMNRLMGALVRPMPITVVGVLCLFLMNPVLCAETEPSERGSREAESSNIQNTDLPHTPSPVPFLEGWGIDYIMGGRRVGLHEPSRKKHILKAGDTIPKGDPDASHVVHAIERDRVFIIREDGIMGWLNKNGSVELAACPPSEEALPSQSNHVDDSEVDATDGSEKQRVPDEEPPVVYVDDAFLEGGEQGFETILESINFEEQPLREMACLLSAYGEVEINVRGTVPAMKVSMSIERPRTVRESLCD